MFVTVHVLMFTLCIGVSVLVLIAGEKGLKNSISVFYYL